MQNVHRGVRCVARSTVLLEPHVVYVHIVQSGPNEIGNHSSVAVAVDDDGHTNVVFKKVRTNHASDPKSAPDGNFLWMHCHLMNLLWVGVIPYTADLLVYKAIHPKMRLVAKDDFSAKIGVLFQTLRCPVSKQTALSVVINFELLGQLDLVRVQAQVPNQNSPS